MKFLMGVALGIVLGASLAAGAAELSKNENLNGLARKFCEIGCLKPEFCAKYGYPITEIR